MGKFVVTESGSGFKFELRARNGEMIAFSAVYTAWAACEKGIMSVKSSCIGPVEDQTLGKKQKKLKHPKYEVYRDEEGKFRFMLKARNGEVIADSQAYKTKANCFIGIESVRKNAPDAEVIREKKDV